MPKGYYKIKEAYNNIADELLKFSIARQIDYKQLNKYFVQHLSSSIVTTYNLYFVTKYVLKYIEAMKGGEKMVTTEKILI